MKSLLALLFVIASSCPGAADFGAVVMHGKWGSPDQHVEAIASALTKAGYLVVSPEMPWSRRRNYDRSVEDADGEIDAEIGKLKAGPMNMTRNAGAINPTPVLWLVPTPEESPLREGNIALFKRLPANPSNQLAEPASDHLNAPQASVPMVLDWLRALEKK